MLVVFDVGDGQVDGYPNAERFVEAFDLCRFVDSGDDKLEVAVSDGVSDTWLGGCCGGCLRFGGCVAAGRCYSYDDKCDCGDGDELVAPFPGHGWLPPEWSDCPCRQTPCDRTRMGGSRAFVAEVVVGSKGSPFAVGTTSHRSLVTSPRPVTRLLRRSPWSTTFACCLAGD